MTETFRVKHILISDIEDANELFLMLNAGSDFSELAKEYSECDSSSKGGDLGSFLKGQFVPEFEAAFFLLDPDEYSSPVKTKYGYHIIYRVR